jgi:D-alanine-D-alanine ligase
MKSKIKVGVIFGGRSVENEISVLTAIQAINALDKERYEVTPIYISKQGRWYTGNALTDSQNYRHMDSLLASCDEVYLRPTYGDNNLYKVNKPLISYFKQMFNISKDEIAATLDVILPALHGTNCEDGSFQGAVEMTGIPYAGCNVLASANGMDKITMKMILKESGIPVIDYTWFSDKEWYDAQQSVIERVESTLGYPVIVKPADSGSSVGISAVHNREELIEATDNAASFSKRIIVEHLVEQLKEINCSVLGNYYDCEASVCEAPIRSG